jgi:outer membrane protein assembly factor BamA
MKVFRLLTVIVIVVMSMTALSMPARILSVNFIGNHDFSQRRLRGWLGLNKGNPWNPEQFPQLAKGLLEQCQDRGYYFVRVDSLHEERLRDSSQVRLTVFFYEGGRTHIASLEVVGDTLLDKNVLHGLLQSHVGGIFQRSVFLEDVGALLRWHEERGYPFCQVEPEEAEVSGSEIPQLHLSLKVNPGPLVQVDFLTIEGNIRTRRNVVVREIRIPMGTLYSEREVERSVKRLHQLGFFESVENPAIVKNTIGKWGLYYHLVERPTYHFDGVLGYQPSAGNQEGYLTGMVDIVLANLMGTGRLAEAHWSRQSPSIQELAVRYKEPWLLGIPLSLGVGFRQRVEDTLYVQRSWDVSPEYQITDVVRVWGSLSREEVLPDSSGVLYLGLSKSSAWAVELGVTVDTRDEPMNPRSGYYYRSSGSAGLRDVEGDNRGNLTEHRALLDVEGVHEPFRFWVLDLQGHYREYRGPDEVVSLPNLYRLGGASSLRGYREEQFLGQRVIWTNAEWRRILGELSRAFVFLDTGYYYRRVPTSSGSVETLDDFLVGWGIGLRVETSLGVVGFDYGLGEGDRLTNGKVHFRLTNRF